MWAEETKNGKVKYVERYTDYMTDKEHKVSVTFDKDTAANSKKAYDILQKKISQKMSATASTDLTFKELIEKYRAYQLQTVRQATYSRNYFTTKTLIKMLGADTLINRLNASYLKDRFLASDSKPSTLNEYRIRLLAILRWAYEQDYLTDISYLAKFKPFHEKETKREKIQDKFLEPEEATKILDHARKSNQTWYYLAKFMLLTGLRVGEAIALDDIDVNLDTRLIHVTKTCNVVEKKTGTTKTESSTRDVPIQDSLVPLVKEIRLYNKKQRLYYGYGQGKGLFFTSRHGDYLGYYAFNKYLKETGEKILDKRVTTHVLRHTHASLLFAEGYTLDEISRRMGHADSKVTREIYIHVTKKLQEKDMENFKNAKIL